MPISRLFVALLLTVAALVSPVSAAEPRWIRVASSHFLVLTDGDEKQGREVAAALRADAGRLRPTLGAHSREHVSARRHHRPQGRRRIWQAPLPRLRASPFFEAAFSIPGEDREFFVLDLAEADNWRAISHEFGRMLLNYNYPPTPAWFDEGFAEYFASLHLDNKQMQIGDDPEPMPAIRQSLLGKLSRTGNPPQALVDLLNKSTWMTLPALFTAKPESPPALATTAKLCSTRSRGW